MILVVGASGHVGGQVAAILLGQGKKVKALVRHGTESAKQDRLVRAGARLVQGDLKDPESLRAACGGVRTVISTASATISRRGDDSIERVDRDGQMALIDAATGMGAQHFIYVSFSGNIKGDFPLCTIKRAVEDHLRQSGIGYTILRPSYFMEVWLSPHTNFDPVGGRVRLYGSGENPVSFVSASDVARYVAGSVDNPAVLDETIELGGPAAVSPARVVRLFEEALGREIAREQVPESVLEQRAASAGDAVQRSIAGLALNVARGDRIDVAPALARVAIRLTPVEDYVSRVATGADNH
jgi:NADH dehydrogenase